MLMVMPWNGKNQQWPRFFNKIGIFFPAQSISILMKNILAMQKACCCTLSVMFAHDAPELGQSIATDTTTFTPAN